jgi:hypothetical protein
VLDYAVTSNHIHLLVKVYGLAVVQSSKVQVFKVRAKRVPKVPSVPAFQKLHRFSGETLLPVVLFWVAHMKKRKTTWIVLVIVCLTLLGGRDWLASTKAAGFFVLKQEGRSRGPALLPASADEESPYIAPYVPTRHGSKGGMGQRGQVFC